MAKLYPPLIEGILPAFTSEIITQEREIDGLNYTTVSKRTNLTIAFEHNPSIVKTETKGMQLYMVAAQDNSLIATEAFYWPSVKNEKDEITYIAPEDSVTFELTGY